MKYEKKITNNILISSIIFSCLFLALIPVILSNNYLRQDDLMWELWPGMKMSDFGFLYYNTVFQLVRPLCMLSFYLTDLLSINMHLSVYVRLFSLIAIGLSGILLYFWQLKFNSNRILAVTFSISTFTLPAYQLFAATANYFLILCALLLTFGAAFCWSSNQKRYLYLGNILFFLSLLEYPLSSMFIWLLLLICYINSLSCSNTNRIEKKRFVYFSSLLTIALMGSYFVFMNVFHWVFHVDLNTSRAGVIESSHLFSRLLVIFNILLLHANFWKFNCSNPWEHYSLYMIICLFVIALLQINIANGLRTISIIKNILITLFFTFIAFFLAYSPIFALAEQSLTFRYTLVTMPILLYISYWSLSEIAFSAYLRQLNLAFCSKLICGLTLITTTLFGMCYANWMISDGIVGPHEHDFNYIQKLLNDKVIPLLKQNKQVVIHAIDCNNGKSFDYHYPPNLPTAFEYGMRICTYQQQVIGVIFHSMMVMGHLPNFHKHNSIIYKDNENAIIVKDTPWGTLIVNSGNDIHSELKQYAENKREIIEIDMRKIPPYQPYEFYKNVFKSFITRIE